MTSKICGFCRRGEEAKDTCGYLLSEQIGSDIIHAHFKCMVRVMTVRCPSMYIACSMTNLSVAAVYVDLNKVVCVCIFGDSIKRISVRSRRKILV